MSLNSSVNKVNGKGLDNRDLNPIMGVVQVISLPIITVSQTLLGPTAFYVMGICD
jgi:hypothetical protein